MLITQNGEAKLVVMDVRSYEKYEETLAMLKILSMGSYQIETGAFRNADDVLSDLNKDSAR